MVQVLEKDHEKKYSIVLEEIIIIEELPMEEEKHEEEVVAKREKPQKRALRNLLKKAKYNANYLKEVKRIEDIKNRINVRNRAIY
ncbi:MAG: hypothetical protein ACFE9S_03755 [Candidatus Hermodarchaeota archaeon]